MVKPIVLVVGLGEVGRSLFELLKEGGKFEVYGLDVKKQKMRDIQQRDLPKKVSFLHICYGCHVQEDFINITVDYVKQFRPELTIINSTVPPRTTEKVFAITKGNIVHSPVRGMHKSKQLMKKYLLSLTKYIGGVNDKSVRLASKHFSDINLKTKVLRNTIDTELGKLFETTYRAWMIVCFQEMHRISRHFGAHFNEVVDFLEDTHLVRFDRPIMFPDVIGGHCLIPNAELLLKSYDSEFLRLLLKSNEQRKEEIKSKDVLVEIQKVKHRVENLEETLLQY